MQVKLVILLLTILGTCHAQKNPWKKLVIDQNRDFQVESLYDVIDLSMIGESPDTVRAALVVNDNPYNVIRFAKVFYNDDRLSILIHESNEADDHEYLISILKDKYKIKYITMSPAVKMKMTDLSCHTKPN